MHPQDDQGEAFYTLTLSSAVAAKLRVLDISGCWHLHSIDVVRSCAQLRRLWMPCCFNVTDLSPLAACSETLEELWMAGSTSVMSLAPLKACTRLRKLDLRGCFELHDQVQDLRLACTQLADPASLKIEGLVHDLQPSNPPYMQEGAATALITLSQEGGLEAKAAIAAAGALPALVQLLASDSKEVREAAAWTLSFLARGHAQQAAISFAGAIPGIVQLLRPGPLRGRRAAGQLHWAAWRLNILRTSPPSPLLVPFRYWCSCREAQMQLYGRLQHAHCSNWLPCVLRATRLLGRHQSMPAGSLYADRHPESIGAT
jgi:hypothetical protein